MFLFAFFLPLFKIFFSLFLFLTSTVQMLILLTRWLPITVTVCAFCKRYFFPSSSSEALWEPPKKQWLSKLYFSFFSSFHYRLFIYFLETLFPVVDWITFLMTGEIKHKKKEKFQLVSSHLSRTFSEWVTGIHSLCVNFLTNA